MAKATADIRSLARAQTALAIRTLTGVCGSKAAPAAARVSAASALLDRGWGKAPQPHTGEDDKDIRITIGRSSRAVTATQRHRYGRRLVGRPPWPIADRPASVHARDADLYLHQQGPRHLHAVRARDVPDVGRICRVRTRHDPGTGDGRADTGGRRHSAWPAGNGRRKPRRGS